ncbi:alpha/beta hydrolase [Streptomyces sp. NPDC059009]|uniref:alpha/beta hydrolase n=1 Tax=Streptomyces sp. NPDC059009 TaxID=3346694 RepID=UPI0036848DCD
MSAEPDRLTPAARPLVDALTAHFPDLGRTVTDAVEARRILAAAPASPVEPPAVGAVEDRTIPGPPGAPDLPVRVYLPDPTSVPQDPQDPQDPQASRPTVVFFHGGGWVICGLDTHDATARGLCREAGAAVVSVDYRLAPEFPFPAAVEDAYAAVCWAAEHLGELGGEQGALVVAGDSAGGNLAAVSALAARDRGGPDIALQVLVYPSTDASRSWDSYRRNAEGYFLTAAHCEWFLSQYVGEGGGRHGDGDGSGGADGARDARRDPHLSPALADLRGLPPAHVVTAGCDPLCDEGRAYARLLEEAGVVVTEGYFPGMFHGFFGFPALLPEARAAREGVASAIVRTVEDRKNISER